MKYGIRARLFVGFVSLAALCAAASISSIVMMGQVAHKASDMYSKVTLPMGKLRSVEADLQEIRISSRDALTATSAEDSAASLKEIVSLTERVNAGTAELQKLLVVDSELALLGDFVSALNSYWRGLDSVAEMTRGGEKAEGLAFLRDEVNDKAAKLSTALDAIGERIFVQGQRDGRGKLRAYR